MTKIPYITGFNAYLKTRHISERAHTEYLNSLHDFMDHQQEHNAHFKIAQDTATIHDVDIANYKNFLHNDLKLSPSTINKILSNLNVYFKYLFANKKTSELPTMNINSLKVPLQDDFCTDVFLNLDDYLTDINLHVYTRLLILIISKGFSYQEALSAGFYQTFAKLSFDQDEKTFLDEYHDFIAPLKEHWNNQNLFLSRNKGAKSPLLSMAAIHRDLKADSKTTELDLSPKKLYTTFILILLSTKHPSAQQNQIIDKLDSSSLLYYRRLLRETDFKI